MFDRTFLRRLARLAAVAAIQGAAAAAGSGLISLLIWRITQH